LDDAEGLKRWQQHATFYSRYMVNFEADHGGIMDPHCTYREWMFCGVPVAVPAELQPWAETSGQIRCLIEAKDGAAREVQHFWDYVMTMRR